MIKKPAFILCALLVTAVGGYVYFDWRSPPGTIAMSQNAETIAWIGLATAIIGLLASLVGLASKLLERKSD